MDDRRFDALTRAFASGTSRRTALKGMFGGLVGGVAVATTRLGHAGAQGTPCETPADCVLPDACTTATCDETDGGSFCAYHGGCAEGSCLECDTLSGECVSTCGACQVCDGGECVSTCDACQTCSGGQCVDNCTACQECEGGQCVDLDDGVCCNGTWVPGGQCCADVDCVGPAADFCSSVQCVEYICTNVPECPDGQLCCGLGQEGAHCAECCSDNDCLGCAVCNEVGQCSDPECCSDADCGSCDVCGDDGACHPLLCLLGETCCGGHVCVPEDECCRDVGETCGEMTAADASPQADCCDGLVCCYGQSTNICAQCCGDDDCDYGGTCEDWVCVYPTVCHHDWDCPDHTCCCDDGSCSWHCCKHHHHPHPKPPAPPATGGTVTSLPDTGSGQSNDSSGLFGAAALGAAAAIYAAKKLRETPGEAVSEE